MDDEGNKVSEDQTMEPGWPPMSMPRPKPVQRRKTIEKVDARKVWLQERIAMAMAAVHRLPSDRPRGYKSCMPAPVKDAYEIFATAVANGGQWEATMSVRMSATAEDIHLIDSFLGWLAPLDLFERRLVAARGRRVPWRVLAEQDVRRRSVRQLQTVYNRALDNILRKIRP